MIAGQLLIHAEQLTLGQQRRQRIVHRVLQARRVLLEGGQTISRIDDARDFRVSARPLPAIARRLALSYHARILDW